MTKLAKHLIMHTEGKALESNIVQGKGYRLTLLTEQLLRIEVNPNDCFEDGATQAIINRNLPKVDYETSLEGNILKISTDKTSFEFNIEKKVLNFVCFGENKVIPSNKGNLKGTYRTLDMCSGDWTRKFDKGLVSSTGVAVYDDSDNLIINSDGEIEPRKYKETDIYIFAYGSDFSQAIKDFYKISGFTPLVPRYALGNWWSRYHAYSDKEYLSLMDEFAKRDIPLTIATIDMDWHWVDVIKRFKYNEKFPDTLRGGGWTGYSWNTELFPDYKDFLSKLQEKNLKVTLNLHPKQGIRFFEDCYAEMAKAMDIDPESKKTIEFDITDNKFINNYFKILHNKMEDEGVDFWWIDWQQGKKSKIEGLDPLWSLNHYHFLDNARDGRQPLILSRYAKVGSHRYPLGFSGDTACNWRLFNFIPYFTANATNVGYTWWSHDIGGHHYGWRDDELFIRWMQFGLFSPILRLHSTSNPLMGKEPWVQGYAAEKLSEEYLRLRHKFIPYIYTYNYLTHTEGEALIRPMYYDYPEEKEFFSKKLRNQYMFGKDILIAPITTKTCKKSGLASVKAFIPEGRWTDLFTNQVYNGNGLIELVRDIRSMPALAKEGAILPLSGDSGNSVSNPKELEVWAYRGNNSFSLYEDNASEGKSDKLEKAFTHFEIKEEGNTVKFSIKADENKSVIPSDRTYKIKFKDIIDIDKSTVLADGKEIKCVIDKCDFVCLTLNDISDKKVEIVLENFTALKNRSYKEFTVSLASKWQAKTLRKTIKYRKINRASKTGSKEDFLAAVKKSLLPKTLKKSVYEQLLITD